jgi:HlyD family secretion protein
MRKRLIQLILVLGIVGVGAGAAWYLRANAGGSMVFRTALVERGELMVTISSTATIEPEEVIDVGAQVAGMIKAFGRDPRDKNRSVDYGTPVEQGTVLAQIDDAIYRTQVHQAKASLDNAKAVLLQTKTKLELSKRNWDRVQTLRQKNAATQADYDTSFADIETSKPGVAASEAAVAQAMANLELAETNLAYTTIKSPVKGVIVDRRVNVGQTVVASLNAPSLFLIAKDLNRLQLWASVNEADIGQIHPGQSVRFTVDAYPRKTFHGVVSQIRLNATMTQNVVTYTVVVNTDNSDGQLLPYMTANVQFEIARRENALLVPSAALRWRPQSAQVAEDERDAFVQASPREAANPDQGAKKGAKSRQDEPVVWREDNGFVRSVPVQTGLTDGAKVEVSGALLRDGLRVVVGEVRREERTAANNPFLPSLLRPTSRPQQKQ